MLPGIYMDIDFYAKVDEELAKIPYCSPKCNYYMACPVCDRSDTNAAPCVLLMLEESPQSLIFGRQKTSPGPGEAGFAAPLIVRE